MNKAIKVSAISFAIFMSITLLLYFVGVLYDSNNELHISIFKIFFLITLFFGLLCIVLNIIDIYE
jgi:hypothetical protein